MCPVADGLLVAASLTDIPETSGCNTDAEHQHVYYRLKESCLVIGL